jgi:putative FmdB family regulatory protein
MTYDYRCETCDHMWEEEQKISEAPVKLCPSCKAQAAKRLISKASPFILKGKGWYKDGYV